MLAGSVRMGESSRVASFSVADGQITLTKPVGTEILGSPVSIHFSLSHLRPAGLEAFVVVYPALSSRSEFEQTVKTGPSGVPIYLSPPQRLSSIETVQGYDLTTGLGLSAAVCGTSCPGVYPVELRVASSSTGRTVSQVVIPVPVLSSKIVSPKLNLAVVAEIDPSSFTSSFIADLESELLGVNVPFSTALSGGPDSPAMTLRRISDAIPKRDTLTRAFSLYAPGSMMCARDLERDGLSERGSLELDKSLIGTSSVAVFPQGANATEIRDAAQSGADTLVLGKATGTSAAILASLGEPLVLSYHSKIHVLVADRLLDEEFREAGSPLGLQILEADLTQYYFQDPYQGNRIAALVTDLNAPVEVSRFGAIMAGISSNPAISLVGATRADFLPSAASQTTQIATGVVPCSAAVLHRVAPVAAEYGAFASSVNTTALPGPLVNAQGYLYSALSNDQSLRALSSASRLLTGLRDDISLAGSDHVTLTAHTAKIPLSLAASLPFPVTVRVELSAPQLQFPSGSSYVVQLAHKTQTVDIKVVGNTLGEFPMQIRLVGRDGVVIFHGRVEVDSTGFSSVGVAITVLAALVLLVWWVRTARRSRKRAAHDGR